MTNKEVANYLCYYDTRNPNGISIMVNYPDQFGLDEDEIKEYGPFSKADCGCDNCFYGRTKLARYILALQNPV